MKAIITFFFLAGVLVGCGGGGGSSDSPSLTPPPPTNSPPSASDSEISLDEDTEYSGAFNFTDPDGDSLTYSVVSEPANGVIDLDSSGSYTYTPNPDFYGADSVTVRVSDGADSVDIVLTITVNDVEELTVFKEEANVIDLSLFPVAEECGKQEIARGSAVVSEMVFPVNINDDEYTDLFVLYFCPPAEQYFGIEHDLVSINYIVPYLSNSDGSYSAAPVEVFGEEFPKIPHMPRKFVRADFNSDGKDDFALAINHDDGRLNQEVPVQAVVLSQPDNKYSIEAITTPQPMMAHAISLARNELGGMDIIWGGYCCGVDVFAYRYDDGEWINVSENYPQSATVELTNNDWGTETRADMRFGEPTQRILSHMNYQISDSQKAIGMNLWKKTDGVWAIEDVYERITEGVVQFVSWSTGQPQPEPYLTIDGRELLVSGVMTENMCIFEEEDNVTLMIIFPGMGLDNSDTFDKEEVYADNIPELEFVKPLLFFDITNDEFELLDREIVDEFTQASGNFYRCNDVNNDGKTDIVLEDFSNTWQKDFVKTPTPLIYIQNEDGNFTNVDYDPEGLLQNEFGGHIGLLADMNNDGIEDLVRYTLDISLDPSYDGFEETVRIYYGKEHLKTP
ncbi:MAG TPA: hypothetical protein DEX20_08505 [Halieaceae bacterium]|nr:hypothetical protein [Halieaceae bacterium]